MLHNINKRKKFWWKINISSRQINLCQFWYNGASKCFVEMMNSIAATKIEAFLTSLNE